MKRAMDEPTATSKKTKTYPVVPVDCWYLIMGKLSAHIIVTFSEMSKEYRKLIFCTQIIGQLKFVAPKNKKAEHPSFFENIQNLTTTTKCAARFGIPRSVTTLKYTHNGRAKDIPEFNKLDQLMVLDMHSAYYPAQRIRLPEGLQELDIRVGITKGPLGLPKTLNALYLSDMNLKDRLPNADEFRTHKGLKTLGFFGPVYIEYLKEFIPPNIDTLHLGGNSLAYASLADLPPNVQKVYLRTSSIPSIYMNHRFICNTLPGTVKELHIQLSGFIHVNQHYAHLLESVRRRTSVQYYLHSWNNPYFTPSIQ